MIAYWARLDTLGLSITWASRLDITPDGARRMQSSLRPNSPPVATDGLIQFAHPALKLQGQWTPIDPPYAAVLHESEEGSVDWRCHCPRGHVAVQLNGRTVIGLGYAEQLTMTIPPWRLPISELRWGRFLSPEIGLVWIRWDGATPLGLALHNGRPARRHSIDDDGITADGLTLSLEPRCTIREGRIGPNMLYAIPGIDRVAPRSILNAHETKWLSRGCVQPPDGNAAPSPGGWAIHELFRFAGEAPS